MRIAREAMPSGTTRFIIEVEERDMVAVNLSPARMSFLNGCGETPISDTLLALEMVARSLELQLQLERRAERARKSERGR